MGAENSILNESDIEKEYFQINDWNLHSGTCHSSQEITVFRRSVTHKRETEIHANLGTCLKRFRHPGIVKYVASGRQGDDIYVVTERVSPLSKSLTGLCASEICAGLYSVLQALEFCHDKCQVRHNNFGLDSVFVTTDGTWKLAGMEFLCSRDECTEEFLQKNRAFRNESRIPPEEKEGRFAHLAKHSQAGDVYAVGIFLRDILEYVLKTEEYFPHAHEFLDSVRKKALSAEPTSRPGIGSLIRDDFFKNDFLDIVTFLKNLTVKDEADRQKFFGGLTERLLSLPESLVATRLASPLLARFVLLDESAGLHFLSDFFRPFRGGIRPDSYVVGVDNPILTVSSYRANVIPILIRIFEVHDFNVRMILLRHFEHYVDLFDLEVLKSKILPQILLGVRDTNNELVMSSLHALAFIVPILGGDVVIGRNRSRHFTEAKPKDVPPRNSVRLVRAMLPVDSQLMDVIKMAAEEPLVSSEATADSVKISQASADERRPDDVTVDDDDDRSPSPETLELERSSPDGGEADANADVIGDCESWSDWEGLAEDATIAGEAIGKTTPYLDDDLIQAQEAPRMYRRVSSKELGEEFDIVAVAIKGGAKEEDFFADMEPVLSKGTIPPATRVPVTAHDLRDTVVNKRLSYVTGGLEDIPTGWDDDLVWTDGLAM